MFWRKAGLILGVVWSVWIWMDPGICYGASDKDKEAPSYFITEWLVAGPFPNEWEEDYIDFLGGEGDIEPVEGMAHLSEVAKEGETVWKKHTTGENGFLDFEKLYTSAGYSTAAYAFAYIESDRGQRVLLELRTRGSSQIWLNGRLIHIEQRTRAYPRLGNRLIYVELKRGRNPLLVKLPGSGTWGFALRVRQVKDRLVVDTANRLLPDLRVGEQTDGWGYVSVVNTSGAELTRVELRIQENELFEAETVELIRMEPGQVHKMNFKLRTKRAVTSEDNPVLQAIVWVGREAHPIELKPRVRKREEYFVRTYRSEIDDSVQPYALLVPEEYDGSAAFPLVVALHGANVHDEFNIRGYTMRTWCIIVAPYGRGSTRYREIGRQDIFGAIEAVKRAFRVDEDRIYLTGHSMGGYGTFHLGLFYPDRFAALVPIASPTYYDRMLYDRRGMLWADDSIRWVQRALVGEIRPILFVENALNLSILVCHAAEDEDVDVLHSRRMVVALRNLEYDVGYIEVPGQLPGYRNHWWGTFGRNLGTDAVNMPPIFTFFDRHRRVQRPPRVRYSTTDLRYNGAYWVWMDEMEELYRIARIDAQSFEDNRIEVQCENVVRFTLSLKQAPIDLDAPVTVEVNGYRAFSGTVPSSGDVVLRSDEQTGRFSLWTDPAKGLRKRPTLFGPAMDAYNGPFMLVVGTQGNDEEEIATNRRVALLLATKWDTWAHGNCIVKRDVDVTEEDMARCNLVLIGSPQSNAILSRINSELPIRFEDGAVVMGDRRFVGEDVALHMIYPNPLNPDRYVIVKGGTTRQGTELMPWLERRLPDYVIFDGSYKEMGWAAFRAAGFFDSRWGLEDR
jgi:pimeloyl-ACP methyl ester carboxylesterase